MTRGFVKRNVRAPRSVGGQAPLAFALVQQPISPRVVRKQPRVAARGRVLFTRSGKPVSVRNAPNVRRLRKRRR